MAYDVRVCGHVQESQTGTESEQVCMCISVYAHVCFYMVEETAQTQMFGNGIYSSYKQSMMTKRFLTTIPSSQHYLHCCHLIQLKLQLCTVLTSN